MRLYIHVGNEKTGSTALQHYFSETLRHEGCYYPISGRGSRINHRNLFHSLAEKHDVSGFISEIERKGAVLISSEAFSFMNSLSREAFHHLYDLGLDITLVCVVRPANDFLKSLYMEGLKWGRGEDFATFTEKHLPRLQASKLKEIAEGYGWSAIFIKYDRDNLVREVARHVPGLPSAEHLPYANLSLSKSIAPFLLEMNRFIGDKDKCSKIVEMISRNRIVSQNHESSFFSLPEKLRDRVNEIERDDPVRAALFAKGSRHETRTFLSCGDGTTES